MLRGIALLGVLLMNFVAFAGEGWMATKAQLESLPTHAADVISYEAIRIFVGDKANTVFATLFGLGFYLQMKRGEGRPGFEARYRRRLFWLLVFGWLNVTFLWVWDILNLYALAGFFLLLTRRWSTRTLVIFGTIAAVYSDKVQTWLVKLFFLPIPSTDHLFTDAAILERQAVAIAGSYPAIVAAVGRMALTNYLVQGFLYAFVLFGVGPGLGLAGRIGATAVVAICVSFFVAQILFSHWWLARYRFGPMEWVWRTLTYSERPTMRRGLTAAIPAQA